MFRSKEEQKSTSSGPTHIKEKTMTYNLNLGRGNCTLTIENALYGEVAGKEILLDEVMVQQMVDDIGNAIRNNATKYNPIPTRITLSRGISQEGIQEQEVNKVESSNQSTICYTPKLCLEEIYLEPTVKKQILSVINMLKHKDKLFNEWGLNQVFKNGRGIILNFYGKPGTGKSVTAEAIAGTMGKKVCAVNYSELESKYVGETPKNISAIFRTAMEQDAVIIFDEADSFLGKRLTNVSQSADYGVNITRSVMLLELEKYEGIVIFTTNLLTNYDDAFKRRILASIEFNYPDEEGRAVIWRMHMPASLPIHPEVTALELAMTYEGITGADIKDIILNAALVALENEEEIISKEHFDKAYEYVKGRYDIPEHNHLSLIKTERISKDQYEDEIQNLNKGEDHAK